MDMLISLRCGRMSSGSQLSPHHQHMRISISLSLISIAYIQMGAAADIQVCDSAQCVYLICLSYFSNPSNCEL